MLVWQKDGVAGNDHRDHHNRRIDAHADSDAGKSRAECCVNRKRREHEVENGAEDEDKGDEPNGAAVAQKRNNVGRENFAKTDVAACSADGHTAEDEEDHVIVDLLRVIQRTDVNPRQIEQEWRQNDAIIRWNAMNAGSDEEKKE